MIGLSAVVIARAVLSGPASTATEHKKPANEEKTGPGNVLKAVFYAVLMGCYAILLHPVGFLITTPVFLVFILKIVERQSWKIAVSVTLGLTALSYILFAYLLTVPLPRGLLT